MLRDVAAICSQVLWRCACIDEIRVFLFVARSELFYENITTDGRERYLHGSKGMQTSWNIARDGLERIGLGWKDQVVV